MVTVPNKILFSNTSRRVHTPTSPTVGLPDDDLSILEANILVEEKTSAVKETWLSDTLLEHIPPTSPEREIKGVNTQLPALSYEQHLALSEYYAGIAENFIILGAHENTSWQPAIDTKSSPTQLEYDINELLNEYLELLNKNILLETIFAKDYSKAIKRINSLYQNPADEYPFNEIARDAALEALELLRDYKIVPSLINSTDDESLLFEFFIGKISYSIEFHNSGEIFYLRKIKKSPSYVFEITKEGLKEFASEISSAYARNRM